MIIEFQNVNLNVTDILNGPKVFALRNLEIEKMLKISKRFAPVNYDLAGIDFREGPKNSRTRESFYRDTFFL